MRSLQRPSRVKKFLYSKLTVLVLLVILTFLFSAVWSMYQKYRMTEENVLAATMRLDQLKEQKEELLNRVDRLETKRGKEAELRSKFLIAKEGEDVLVIVEDDPSKSKKKEGKKKIESETGWWENFLAFF